MQIGGEFDHFTDTFRLKFTTYTRVVNLFLLKSVERYL